MLELTVDGEGIYLHSRLTTHEAAESQTKGRCSLEILPVELRRNADELQGTCAGWRCTGLMAGGALWSITFSTTQETGLCMNGGDGLVLTLFLFGADTQFRYLNKIKSCFFPLAIELEAGRWCRTCYIYLDDWLVVFC
jgi:hypothetical protein